ncbi:MAG TPA: LPS export ABC transporter permease LptG [Acetobacteraceae bacterium]|nr:LPS export ABC transporter permease LptG [Acetobacteraceae bacterium]
MTLLDRYIEAAALRAFALVAVALTTLFSLLEFVEQLSSVGQGHYRLIDALVYVLLTTPARLLQVTPISMLLGSLLALGALARTSELTALQSLGISEIRIIGSIVKLAVPIVIALFLLAEFVIPPAQQLAQEHRTSALSSLPASAPLRSGDSFWAQSDRQYLNVQQFEYGNVPKDIDIYTFADDGSLESFIHADRADIRPDGTWLLTDVLRKRLDSSQFQTEHLASLPWHSFMLRKQTQLLMLPPESLPPIALYRYVHDLKQRHQQAIRYEQELWTRISIPLSIVAMIMIAAPFVFGPPRAQNTGQHLMIGAIVGIIFSMSQQIVDHLGLLLDLNPAVTALAPSLLLMALAVYLFRRAHR